MESMAWVCRTETRREWSTFSGVNKDLRDDDADADCMARLRTRSGSVTRTRTFRHMPFDCVPFISSITMQNNKAMIHENEVRPPTISSTDYNSCKITTLPKPICHGVTVLLRVLHLHKYIAENARNKLREIKPWLYYCSVIRISYRPNDP